MKLLEKLNALDAWQLVYIGSANAWFDVGYAGVIRRPQYMTALNKREHDKFVKSRATAEHQLMLALNRKIAAKMDGEHSLDENVDNYILFLTKYTDYVDSRRKFLHNAEDTLARYVPIAQREVLEVNPRLSDNGVTILLPGDETGDYWFWEEKYESGLPSYDEALAKELEPLKQSKPKKTASRTKRSERPSEPILYEDILSEADEAETDEAEEDVW